MLKTQPPSLTLSLTPEAFKRLEDLADGSKIVLGEGLTFLLQRPQTIILQSSDQEHLLRASNAVRALGLGFSMKEALGLLEGDSYLAEVPLRTELPPRDKRRQGRSPRARLLSHKALNLRSIHNFTGIRNFTGIAYRLEGDRLWILGPAESVKEASRQIRLIARGRSRGTVQQYHRGRHGMRVESLAFPPRDRRSRGLG